VTQPPWPVDAHGKPVPRRPDGWPDFAAVNWPSSQGQWAPVGPDGRPLVYGAPVPASPPAAFPAALAGLPGPPAVGDPTQPLPTGGGMPTWLKVTLGVVGVLAVLLIIGAIAGSTSKGKSASIRGTSSAPTHAAVAATTAAFSPTQVDSCQMFVKGTVNGGSCKTAARVERCRGDVVRRASQPRERDRRQVSLLGPERRLALAA